MPDRVEKFKLVQTSRGPRTVFTGDVTDLVHNQTMEGLARGFGSGDSIRRRRNPAAPKRRRGRKP